MEVRTADATVAPAIRVGLAVGIVLIGGGLLGAQHLVGLAALGALCSAFGRYEPYPRMAGKLAIFGVTLIAFVGLGATIGAAGLSLWAQITLLSVAAGAAALILTAFRIAGPGPVILIFAATAAVASATTLPHIAQCTVAATVGVVVGWMAAMAPWLVVPMGPARLAVARALAAVGKLEHAGHTDLVAARNAIAHAREVIALSGRRQSTAGHGRELAALLDEAESAVEEWMRDQGTDRLRGVARHEPELRKVKREIMIPRLGTASVMESPRPAGFITAGIQRLCSRDVVANAVRIAIASALSGWFAVAAGMDHALWASMGAMAALQGLTFHSTVQRAIQRLLGNVAGSVIAAVLIAMALNYWEAVVAIIVLQIMAELLVIKNYALTSIAITPMALILTGLGAHITPDIALSRVVDTLIGVVIGVIVAAITISRSDRHHLPRAASGRSTGGRSS